MTRPELFFYTWDQLIDKELRRALAELPDLHLSATETTNTLRGWGWNSTEVQRLLGMEPLLDLPGEPIFLLAGEDLLQKSYTQIRVTIKSTIAQNLACFGSTRAAAEFLGVDDKYLSGLKAR